MRRRVQHYCRWNRAALPLHAVAACVGSILVQQLPSLPNTTWLVACVVVAFLIGLHRGSRWLATGLLAFAWTVWVAQSHLNAWLPQTQSGHDYSIYGWVDGFPSGTAARKTFSFKAESAPAGVPERLRLSWYDPPDFLQAGVPLELTVRLRRPRGLVNPNGFDYAHWLLVKGYGATGYVRTGHVTSAREVRPARAWLRLRARLAAQIDVSAPSPSSAALMTALVIGERYGFTDQQWTDLQRSGTSHLVAISGMNIGLAAVLIFGLVRWLWLRLPGAVALHDLEAAALASAIGACWYTALAGFGVPAQRSLVMLAVALTVLVARRNVSAMNGMAVAALAVLVIDPFAPVSASFWLSFGAVALLFLVGARREVGARPITRRARLRRSAVLVGGLQVGVSFGSIPFVALFFGRVSLISPLANLVAVPYFNLVLAPMTFAGTLCVIAGLPGGTSLMHAAGWLTDWAWRGIHLAASAPGASLGIAPPGVLVLLLAAVGAAVAMPAHPLPGRNWAWCALLPILWARPSRLPPGSAEVTVLDVGHGLAVVVATRDYRLLYDAGPLSPSGFDAGKEIVMPDLAREPGAGLDRLVVSHADADHAGGVASVRKRYPEAQVLAGPDVILPAARTCARGQHWRWDGVDFAVLYPPVGYPALGNESSCVLKITTAAGSLLLDGDIEAGAERWLVRHSDIDVDVVVVPHHGSATSSTSEFVAATSPDHAIVSSAFSSRWNFPRPVVVERWQRAGAVVSVTGDDGALTVTFDDRGIRVLGERSRHKRYWRTLSTSPSGGSGQRAL